MKRTHICIYIYVSKIICSYFTQVHCFDWITAVFFSNIGNKELLGEGSESSPHTLWDLGSKIG